MTQNSTYSGSMSSLSNDTGDNKHDDKRESDDAQSSTEIRAGIDQTRQAVGEKIDQLQARLDPNRLKQQAQETVQEMLTDTAESVTEYVRTHRDEMLGSIADAARRNPLPTALLGLGLGWLILESMAGSKRQDSDRGQYQRHNLSGRDMRPRYQGGMGRTGYSDYDTGYAGGFMEDDYYNEPGYSPSGYASRSGYQGTQEFGAQESGNGHQQKQNPVAKAAGAVKDTVSDMGQGIKESVSGVTDSVTDSISGARESMGESMSDVKDRVGGAVEDLRWQAERMGRRTQRTLQRAEGQVDQWQRRARWEGQRRGRQAMRSLEDNPLIYGAVALAAGAAVALLLPQSRMENRYFGEMRDQVMDKGQEAFEAAKDHAQQVVTEIRPELEEKARQIVSDVKEMGKEVAKDAVEELRPVVDNAISKTKQEARSAAQEVGIDPDKLTAGKPAGDTTSGPSTTGTSNSGPSKGAAAIAGSSTASTPVVNRDTLRGQWKQIKGEVKSKWGQLTDDDLTQAEGDYEKLAGVIQSRYGYTRGRAEQELNDFLNSRKS